ncbi:predicted protein [Nematostella vectensis]|uniref:Uncharacterized protein n=1 Tax=Nematostella vectensis TaxID=45351 RepID=A7SUV6_NEMVE|nr:predicted protein [Nematostella vectensis]|eukprot:XP_001624624.1 predicted protein [Nematostella vectensis]
MESLRMPFAAWFFIWFAVCEIWIVSADLPVGSSSLINDEPSFRQKRSLVHGTTCPKGTFAKDLFCVKRCGPGLYGNIKTWTCEECSKQCRTCSDGTRNDICTSCLNPYYLSDGVCLALCRAGTLSQGPPLRNMRLIGGQTQFEGRLEVYKFGSWGTVCDDGWDILDASVVCRELMLGEALEAVTMAGMGQGSPSQKIHLSGVACNGNETRLDACAHAPWEHNGCGHFEDVGVRCSGPDLTRRCVRSCGAGYYLVAGRQKCDTCDSSCLTCANSSDSCLTCDKPLFLSGNKCLDVCGDGYYGDATSRKCLRCDPICRTCSGNPSNCTSCPFTPDRYLFNNTCLLDCGKTHVIEYATLRLSGKRSSPYEGRVEVLRGDDWLTICDETFDFREATVVCRQLGMGRAIKSVRNAGFGAGKGRIWVDKLYCTGGESNIFDCPMKQMHWNSECYHVNDAGVICSGPQTGSPMSNTCRRSCQEGYYKNDLDICKKCSSQCAACIGTSQRCTKCSAPKFLLKNSCVTQCTAAQYGNTVTRECSPCDTSVCVTCANGPNGRNCSSCVAPRALKDGECMDTCAPDLYEKSGKCVSDCGEEFYQYAGNNTCLACPSECFRCVYEASLGKPRCTSCKPPKVFQNNACNNNCTADQVSVPVLDRIGSATIRLVNGSDYLEGRVEVFYNGEWGTVCDDSWDSKETTVVCRQLNLGEPALKPLGTIAKGTGRIWLDDMWCIGGETSLQQCRHRKWGETNCNHNEDVAIRCKGPGIRRCAEKCPDGQYARDTLCQMCDQSCATCVDTGTKCLKCASGYYLNGTNQCLKDCGPGYYLNGAQTKCLKCDSNCAICEESSTKCTSCQPPNFRLGNKCQADCGAGYKPAPTHGIRLVNGKTSLQGRVEVLFSYKWGTVCDDGFLLRDLIVFLSRIPSPISYMCCPSSVVQVTSGVLFNNKWGTVCDDGFDLRDLPLYCRISTLETQLHITQLAILGVAQGTRGWTISNAQVRIEMKPNKLPV